MEQFLIRIPAEGGLQIIPAEETAPLPDALLCELLHTDVTERLRLPRKPQGFPDDAALCYLIDARGGEKALPANFTGTCFYHTGCPIYGDLLLVKGSIADPDGAANAFTEAEAQTLCAWLREEFGTML